MEKYLAHLYEDGGGELRFISDGRTHETFDRRGWKDLGLFPLETAVSWKDKFIALAVQIPTRLVQREMPAAQTPDANIVQLLNAVPLNAKNLRLVYDIEEEVPRV